MTPKEISALNETAAALGVNPEWLKNLIRFESGFRPDVLNPYTKAAGLIQFMPDTARALGYADQIELIKAHPTIESQLRGPVLKYLQQYRPFPSEQSFYMAVFYPKFRYVNVDTEFPARVRAVNPNIRTVRDYIRKVNPNFPLAAIPLSLIILLAALLLIK